MNPEKIALLAFCVSIFLPTFLFAIAPYFKLDRGTLGPVVGLFWAGAALNLAMLFFEQAISFFYLWFYGIVIILGVGTKIIAAGRKNKELKEDAKKDGVSQPPAATTCCPQLTSQGSNPGQKSSSGSTGTIGWYFWLANAYTWDLRINATSTNNGVFAQASASGTSSDWSEVSFHNHNATAQLSSAVTCRNINGSCEPRAVGGEDKSSSGAFEAAVSIDVLPGKSTDEIILKAELAAAIEGSLAISQIKVAATGGASGGGLSGNVQISTTINIANNAKDSLYGIYNYLFQCSPCSEQVPSSSSSSSPSDSTSALAEPGSKVTGYRFDEFPPNIGGEHAAFKTKKALQDFVRLHPPGMRTKYWRIKGTLVRDEGGPDGYIIKVESYEEISLH